MTDTHTAASERAKYAQAWALDDYRTYSPGEQWLRFFTHMVRPKRGATLVDIGCGTGRATAKLRDRYGYQATGLDFVPEALETDVEFVKVNIFGRWPDRVWDVGYCCDVMEHLPEDRVAKALRAIRAHTSRCWFSICFAEDHFGSRIGHSLHLTVKPFTWWRDALQELGTLKNARDLQTMGVFDVRW